MTAKICLLKSNNDFDMEYTYIVPDEMASEIDVGVFVDVPFGVNSSFRKGLVVSVDFAGASFFVDKKGREIKLKSIKSVDKSRQRLSSDLVELCKCMQRRYLCSMGDIIGLMLPPELPKAGKSIWIKLAEDGETIREVVSGNSIHSIKQIKLLTVLLEAKNHEIEAEELKRNYDISASVIKALCDKGFITKEARQCEDRASGVPVLSSEKNDTGNLYPEKILNEEQKAAVEKIVSCMERKDGSGILLHGVTGSGKTEVYLHAIGEAVKQGGAVIMLVPEISLTPQIIARFKGRFGENVAILHSRLTVTQKRREYEKISNGLVNIVVGARSAVFAPCKNLKLIILDEEQEPSFKSFDSTPYYSADEAAFMRGKICGAAVVLGSATPRVTTYYRSLKGEISYARLTKRAVAGTLPRALMVNMREAHKKSVSSVFSEELLSAMGKNYNDGLQTILFVPRRGFSGRLICGECGKAMVCKKCRVAMTYHKKIGRLVCHYCGNTVTVPDTCPSCGGKSFTTRSIGTEMVETEIKRLFPEADVIRMDADTTGVKDGHRLLLERFEKENVPFLVGTQMIAKGLDFPKVTLVGVINADGLLNVQEYNAGERAFQLLTQVFGRAGRSDAAGLGILQTMDDTEPVYSYAIRQNYDAFYQSEINFRELMGYPPFKVICNVTVSGTDDRATYSFAGELWESIQNRITELKLSGDIKECDLFNLTRAAMPKVNDRYRWIFNIKTDTLEDMLCLMGEFSYKILTSIPSYKRQNYRVSFDIEE